jgi:hypothetical protein
MPENSRMARILYNMGLVYRKMKLIDKVDQISNNFKAK